MTLRDIDSPDFADTAPRAFYSHRIGDAASGPKKQP
jgi:hypothetical protein